MELSIQSIVNEYNPTESQISRDPETQILIEGCLRGERSAQEKLYKKYYGKMMGLCLRYTQNNDDAMETLNTGFLKVFTNIGKYNYTSALGTWIYNIVRNTCIDHLRANLKFNQNVSIDKEDFFEIQSDSNPLNKLMAQDLLRILKTLPQTTGLVFNLFAIEGFSHKEISEQLQITEGTSKWHMCEARKLLKARLEQQLNNFTK